MNVKELKELFLKLSDNYLKFEEIPAKSRLSNRPDLHAFILLDRLVPDTKDIISAAEHDEFWIDVDVEELAKVATEDEVLNLIRCGVRWNSEFDALSFFT